MKKQREFVGLPKWVLIVVIVGILVALAITLISCTSRARAKQIEARNEAIKILQLIYWQEREYSFDHGSFDCENGSFKPGPFWVTKEEASAKQPEAFAEIEVKIPEKSLYTFTITGGPDHFMAKASANLDADSTLDVLTIDQREVGNLICVSDDIND